MVIYKARNTITRVNESSIPPRQRLKAAARCVYHLRLPHRLLRYALPVPNRQREGPDSVLHPDQVREILVVRLDGLGDLILTDPLLAEIRRLFPRAAITMVVRPQSVSFVRHCEHVQTVLALKPPRHSLGRDLFVTATGLRLAFKHLWKQRFDLAISPRWDVDMDGASVITFLSGARRRLGYSETVTLSKRIRNKGADCLFTDLSYESEPCHETVRNVRLLRLIGVETQTRSPGPWTNALSLSRATDFLNRQNLKPQEPLIALGIGAANPRRQWPAARFLAVARECHLRWGARIVVVGGPEDQSEGRAIERGLPGVAFVAAGQCSAAESVALLSHCALFVGNDSGPMHMAASVAVPVIEISCHPRNGDPNGPHSTVRFGPTGVPSSVLQPLKAKDPCTDGCQWDEPHCVLQISVEEVLLAVDDLMLQLGVYPRVP